MYTEHLVLQQYENNSTAEDFYEIILNLSELPFLLQLVRLLYLGRPEKE